ncbi:MAG: YlxR family protein [Clostridia bacterium]|nr:YlxR family protein [Clostridia bacterium]
MSTNKKKPTRTCMGCNESKEKNELLRIVKSSDGEISVDLTGKKNGRGAYICKNEDCLNKIIKSKRLEKVLDTHIPDEIYESIRSVIVGK